MPRGRKIDIVLLAAFFNKLDLSLSDLKGLTASHQIIKSAAEFLFGEARVNACYIIVVAIRRNMGNLSDMIDKKNGEIRTEPDTVPNIFEYLVAKGMSRDPTKLREQWTFLFGEICVKFSIKHSKKMSAIYKKRILRKLRKVNEGGCTEDVECINMVTENLELAPLKDLESLDSTEIVALGDTNECELWRTSSGILELSVSDNNDSARVNSEPKENEDDNTSFEKSDGFEIGKNVSSSFEDIPDVFTQLDRSQSKELKPIGAVNRNNSNLYRAPYADCKSYLGEFQISREEFKEMYKSEVLIDGRWTYVLSKKFAELNSICILNVKAKRYLKKRNCLKVYGYCAHKKCNVFLIYINDFVDTTCNHAVSVYTSSLHYNHLESITRYLKGCDRDMAKRELKVIKPSKSRENRVNKSIPSLVKEGNMQDIKSDSVLRKVRSEAMGRYDRHKDDIYDLCLMQRQNQEYIKGVGQPFHVYIYSLEQLEIALCNADKITLHLDATGSVVRRPKFVKKRIFYYAGVVVTSFNARVCPIMEMYNCQHDTTSIGIWMAKFKYFCIQQKKRWPIFRRVVVDFSFALINATLQFWNNLTLLQYLDVMFEVVTTKNGSFSESLIFVNLCCAHFFKIVSKDIKNNENNEENRRFLKEVIAACMELTEFDVIEKWFVQLGIIMLSKEKSDQVDRALEQLLTLCCTTYQIENEDDDITVQGSGKNVPNEERTLYENSKFYKHFKHIESELQNQIYVVNQQKQSAEQNRYYNEELFQLILKKYMTFLPLWSGVTFEKSEETVRLSNAPVENWFSVVKNLITNTNNLQKCSRSVRLIRKRVLSYYKEIKLVIRKENCTARFQRKSSRKSQTINKELDDKEEWNKKRKVAGSNFDKINLKKIYGSIERKREFTNKFQQYADKNLQEKCMLFLQQLDISEADRASIEKNTRRQRKDPLWYEERRKRLTASLFGDVCKAKKEEARVNAVKRILYKDRIEAAAVQHGIKNEEAGISSYRDIHQSADVMRCGLLIDVEKPFLAASPDGLVNCDGLLEVKCPFSIRFGNPLEAPYLDENGKLSEKHKYYFQIQGLLHISRREWCDLIIWTHNGVHISRIYKSNEFWETRMIHILEDFYLTYLLPEIVEPLYPTRELIRRDWLNRESPHALENEDEPISCSLKYLPNGLIISSNYYSNIGSNYAVAFFEKAFWPELRYEAWETLDGRQWLLDIVVNLSIHCIIKKYNPEKYILLTTDKTYSIFNYQSRLHKDFYTDLPKINSHDTLIMPLSIGRNHWCLIIADLANKIFIYLDPYNSTAKKTEERKVTFLHFLSSYVQATNNILPLDKWTINVLNHIKQNDSYNCGVFIIYFIQQFIQNRPLTDFCCMNSFRQKIRQMLLEMSDDMTGKCLQCGAEVDPREQGNRKCILCKRYCHINCHKFEEDKCILCINYIKRYQ